MKTSVISTLNRMLSARAPIFVLYAAAIGMSCSAKPASPSEGSEQNGTAGVTSAQNATSAAAGSTSSVRPAVATGAAGVASAANAGSRAQTGASGNPAKGDVTDSSGAASGGSGAGAPAPAGAAGASGAVAMTGAAGDGPMSMMSDCNVQPITDDMRKKYENMDEPYYTKFASANGVIVGTGKNVGDEAITRYCKLLGEFTSNEKVRQAILDDDMWFTMISEDEQLSSLPQIDKAYGTSLNQRARGLGGLTPTICAEDSIMCLPGDRWKGDCICPHETGHTLYSSGIAKVKDLSDRLTKITDDTRQSGRISNSYVWMDGDESGMMAWGVQVWYDCAIDGMMGGYHPDINTRAELKTELPDFYEFLSEILPQDNKYEDCYANP